MTDKRDNMRPIRMEQEIQMGGPREGTRAPLPENDVRRIRSLPDPPAITMDEITKQQQELNRRRLAYQEWYLENKEWVDECYRRRDTRPARAKRRLAAAGERVRDAWMVLRGKAWVE
jgi:hypothetical protein